MQPTQLHSSEETGVFSDNSRAFLTTPQASYSSESSGGNDKFCDFRSEPRFS